MIPPWVSFAQESEQELRVFHPTAYKPVHDSDRVAALFKELHALFNRVKEDEMQRCQALRHHYMPWLESQVPSTNHPIPQPHLSKSNCLL